MLKRSIGCLTLLLALLAGSPQLRAQDVPPPTMVIQVRSLDAVLKNIKLLVAFSGRENLAGQIEGLIKTRIGAKGLEGVDLDRPFGVYGQFKGLENGTAVALIPILDESAFLNLLKNLNLTAEKNAKTGIYRITGLPVEIYLRFAHKHAYATTINMGALETEIIPPPHKVFREGQQSAIRAALRLDQLPKDSKFLVTTLFEQTIQNARAKEIPGETEAEKAFRLQVSKEILELFRSVLNEGLEFGLDLDVNEKSEQMSLALSLTAQPNTDLARNIADVGKRKSLFANLRSKDSAVQASITMALPESLKTVFAKAIDDTQKKILASITLPTQKKQAKEFLDALSPTFKAGELDVAVSMQGPDSKKLYSIIAGVKVHKGAALAKTLHSLLADLRQLVPEEDRQLIQLNFDTIAGAKIHKFGLSKFYGEFKDIVGDEPLYLAISDDAIYYAIGPGADLLLRRALTKENNVAAAPFNIEVSLARLWPTFPVSDKFRATREKVQKLFPLDAEGRPTGSEGRVRLHVEGGASLNVRISSHLSLVKLIAGDMK